jgi:peptide/nickel transport system permease protein
MAAGVVEVSLEDEVRNAAPSKIEFVWSSLKKRPSALLGLCLVLFFIVVAALSPWLAPAPKDSRNPYLIPEYGYSPEPKLPSSAHIFGTTEDQYDLYYGMVWGTRTALKVALTVVGFSLIIGILFGGLAGYFGGWTDEILMRFTDVVLALPSLLLAVVIVAIAGPSLSHVMLSVTAVSWPSYARLLRGDVLAIKEREFVQASRALGASHLRVFFRHILPNCVYPLLVLASLDMGSIVITAAALSFLGLGAPLGYADWGQLISLSRNWIMGSSGNPFAYWNTIAIPGLAVFLFVLGWNLMGDGLRDILDPRQSK